MHSIASMTSVQERREGACTYVHLVAYDTYTEMGMGKNNVYILFVYLGSPNGKGVYEVLVSVAV